MPKRPSDPSAVRWTVAYVAPGGDLRPYAPEFTDIPFAAARKAAILLRAKYPQHRFRVVKAAPPQMTVAEARQALAEVLNRSTRPEWAEAARNVRSADIALMAPLAIQAERQQRALDEWARVNERRKAQELPPIPRPDLGPNPDITIRRGRIVIRFGGAK